MFGIDSDWCGLLSRRIGWLGRAHVLAASRYGSKFDAPPVVMGLWLARSRGAAARSGVSTPAASGGKASQRHHRAAASQTRSRTPPPRPGAASQTRSRTPPPRPGQPVRLGVARRLPCLGRQGVARLPANLVSASGQPRIDWSRQLQRHRSVLRRRSVCGSGAMRTGGTTRSCMRSSDQRAKLRRLTKPDILVSATTRRAPGAGSTR